MEKRTFLGIDITPRRELLAEIKRMGKQIEIQERHLVDERKAKERESTRSSLDTYRNDAQTVASPRGSGSSIPVVFLLLKSML